MRLNTRVCAASSGRIAPWCTGRPEQVPLLKGGFRGIVCTVYCTRPVGAFGFSTRVFAASSGRTAPWRTGRPKQVPLLKGGFRGIVCTVYCTRPVGAFGFSTRVFGASSGRIAPWRTGRPECKSPFSKGDLGGLSVRCITRARRGVRI